MKKPSRSFCSVCPKKLGSENQNSDENISPPSNILKKRIATRRKIQQRLKKFRTNRKMKSFTHSSSKVMKRYASIQQPNNFRRIKHHSVGMNLVNNRRPPSVRPPAPKKNTARHINNHYYGIDHLVDIPRPSEGDYYLNILTGEIYLFNKGIWNLIPSPAPRCYLGDHESQIEQIPIPKEGDVFFESDSGRIQIYQQENWNDFTPITPNTLEEIISQHQQLLINNQSISHSLNSMTSDPILHQQQHQTQSKSFTLNLSPDITLNAHYQNLTPVHFQKIQPKYTTFDQTTFLEVTPEGPLNLSLTLPKNTTQKLFHIIEFSLESWVKYADSNKNIWQTVTCLADIEVLDQNQQPISDYSLTTSQPNTLIDLKQEHMTVTTLQPSEKITLVSSTTPISTVRWISKLIAYPIIPPTQSEKTVIKRPENFYAVQFKDLHQPIDLPRFGIKVYHSTIA